MASAASRECLGGGETFSGLQSSVSVIPFWGGSADASGGNAHSKTKLRPKIDQLTGAVCSSLKYFERGIVGVCTKKDRESVVEALSGQWGVEVMGLEVPPYSFTDSLTRRSRANMFGNLKNMKVDVKGGASIEDMALALHQHPEVLAKMPTIPNYGEAKITDGAKQHIGTAKVITMSACRVYRHCFSKCVFLVCSGVCGSVWLWSRSALALPPPATRTVLIERQARREEAGEVSGGVRGWTAGPVGVVRDAVHVLHGSRPGDRREPRDAESHDEHVERHHLHRPAENEDGQQRAAEVQRL